MMYEIVAVLPGGITIVLDTATTGEEAQEIANSIYLGTRRG